MLKNIRKRALFVISVFFLSGFLPSLILAEETNTEAATFSSIKDAIALAYKNNLDIQIQQQDVQIAKANITGAKSVFLPQVNLGAGYTHNAAVLNVNQSVLQGSKKDIGVVTGYQNDNKLGVTVDQTVYSGGANMANLKQARLGLSTQEETLRARKLDMEFETKRLYYGFLLALETERIARELLGQTEAHYDEVNHMYEQGTASKFDLLQSKVQISLVMPELVKARNAVELILADLKALLNMNMQSTLKIEDRLDYSAIEIHEADFLKEAYLKKPEMILKTLGVDISKWGIEYAKAGWKPQVGASAGYNYRSNDLGDMFNKRHNNWNIGFSVTVPIFDGFSTRAKVEEAKAKYAQAVLSKENIIEQIAVQVKQACLDLKEAQAIIDSQKDNIEEAKEALRISEISYINGVGINLDVIDSQVSLSQVEKNLAEGVYDYLMAQASLDRALGKAFFEN